MLFKHIHKKNCTKFNEITGIPKLIWYFFLAF